MVNPILQTKLLVSTEIIVRIRRLSIREAVFDAVVQMGFNGPPRVVRAHCGDAWPNELEKDSIRLGPLASNDDGSDAGSDAGSDDGSGDKCGDNALGRYGRTSGSNLLGKRFANGVKSIHNVSQS
jgi:hypothetical protein